MIHEAPIWTIKDLWRDGATILKIYGEREGTFIATTLVNGQKVIY